jgi:carboxyl-terminal processing protease
MTDAPIRRKRPIMWAFCILIVAAGCFAGGWYLGHAGVGLAGTESTITKQLKGVGSAPTAGALEAKDIQFSQFWELWKMLKLKYYEDASEQKMFYGAMKGMAEAMGDPYTTFFEPKIAKEFSDSLKGEFEGIGAEIGIRDSQLQIIAPLPETPAEKAGLQAGDYILAINGTSTENMPTDQAVSLIRGPKGTVVTLKIGRMVQATSTKDEKATSTKTNVKRKLEPVVKDYKITRDKIYVKSVRLSWPKEGVALVTLSNFNEDTDSVFSSLVDQILAKNAKGLILDLRNNPGGYLDRSTAVAGEWAGDEVIVSERRKGKIVDSFHGTGSGRLKGLPTVVLVNQGSASASEIVAGALQDYGLAKIMGMKTFGKGSVQDYSEFKDGSAIKITIAEWLTPKGRSINKLGIQPDIEVDRTLDNYNENSDPQLDKAFQWLADPGAFAATSTAAGPVKKP